MVAHDLELPNHLADGEEAEALGKDDARGRELRVADPVDEAALRGLEGLGRRLEERAGLSDGLPGAFVEGLEGGHGAGSC